MPDRLLPVDLVTWPLVAGAGTDQLVPVDLFTHFLHLGLDKRCCRWVGWVHDNRNSQERYGNDPLLPGRLRARGSLWLVGDRRKHERRDGTSDPERDRGRR